MGGEEKGFGHGVRGSGLSGSVAAGGEKFFRDEGAGGEKKKRKKFHPTAKMCKSVFGKPIEMFMM